MAHTGIEILLVEDDTMAEHLALRVFQKQRLISKLHVVRDGAEALEFIFCDGAYASRTPENPKLILLDLKLPLVSGIEVLRRIRTDPRTKLIPVVVLTSSEEERDIVEGYELGVNSYIVKPGDVAKFDDAIKHLSYYWLHLNRQPVQVHRLSTEPVSLVGVS